MFKIVVMMLLVVIFSMPLSAQDEQVILDELVSEFASDGDNAAVVAQITIEDETWTTAAGLADGARAATPADRFRIGSTSKTFVAVVALRLAEDGILDLDAPAKNYLSADVVENLANLDSVTIRQLLAMRSGIPDYLETDEFWEAVAENPTHEWTPAEALAYAYGEPALFAPDEEFSYSNSNYLLMQLVLESVSGDSLAVLIREHILTPLEMDNTYTQVTESLSGGFVNGYEDFNGDGEVDEVSGINDGAGLGDGGLISTTADLTAFYHALLVEESLLSDDSLTQLLDFEADDEGSGYSLGFGSWETDAGIAWGHSGAVSGFQSVALYLPDEDAIIVILVASADLDPESLADALIEELVGE